ncbi:hypothetical protein ADK52_15225 [Streptomyces sp. WM6372]|uniref:hypothetical protein n=1 Tax=Streptomyces sp. WM6372 TaxID=1415555 RepID=UPI0006AFC413|nr:hypothetical protein [Streptomyces sp. WM6372]KOU24106.1 hypothetical protein ADK52_15225 [Streptomyces sp. WM6372]
MISEPELEGEWGTDRPTTAAGEPDTPRERVRGPRRAWLWALGGAVLASAVWAGVLTVQDRFGEPAPRIAYRHAEDLCKVKLTAVSASTTQLTGDYARHEAHPALDWAYCAHGAPWVEGRLSYGAEVLVQLHKKADPRTEFGAGPTGLGGVGGMASSGGEVEQVPGLGERALLTRRVGGSRLEVLDGGAVFSLTVQWYGGQGAPDPDEEAVQAAMVEDMRTLMASLRK